MSSRLHRIDSRWGRAAGAGACVLAVVAGALFIESIVADDVSAVPNPYMGREATHTVSIESDGSYDVHIDQTMELARGFEFSFGGMVHDGFRLPDTESVLPPYLRAQYSDPAITMDGQSAEVSVEHTVHAVDISARHDFTEGEHEGTVDYRVTGATVGAEHGPTAAEEDGVTVYLRPLVPGDVIVTSAEPIMMVECEKWAPDAEPCGHKSGDVWLIGNDELDGDEVVRITLDADEGELIEPRIDSTK